MRKIQSMLVVAFLAIVLMFVSCKKETVNNSTQPKYVKAIAGSFVAKDGDVTFKSSPVGVNRTWTVYAKNSTWYGYASGADKFDLVRGLEFVTGSVAYNYWVNVNNNPVTFSATQPVYSNLTPDENLRIVSESKNSSDNVAYLGILDFKPSQVNFPLTVNCIRLGDSLIINTSQLTSLPGGNHLAFSVTYDLAPVDLTATKIGTITGTGGVPNGTQLQYSDIKYGASASIANQAIGSGNCLIYGGLDKKVMGNIVIKIIDTYTGLVNDQPVATITLPAQAGGGPGHGLKLTLHTTKVGWLDSGVITFGDSDITVTSQQLDVN